MYLHQSNNLGNCINITTNCMNITDIHNDAFHNASSSNNLSTTTDTSNLNNLDNNSPIHSFSDKQLNFDNQLIQSDLINKFNEVDDNDFDNIKKFNTKNNLNQDQCDNFIKSIKFQTMNDLDEKTNYLSLSCSSLPSISSATSTLQNSFATNTEHFKLAKNQLESLSQNKKKILATKNDNRFDLYEDPMSQNNFDLDPNDLKEMAPLTRFLSLHPQYLDLFEKFHNFLLNGDGPLKYTVRHYIAIMAAARHHCKYLVNVQQEQFIKVGGDINWLKGIQYAPIKIQNLNEINKILAHQPWLLTKEHIEKLTKGNDSWSLSELVQAIIIMAHFHTLSSFVFGCGFNEADLQWNSNLTPYSNYNSNNISDLLLFRNLVSSAPPSPPSPNNSISLNGVLTNSNQQINNQNMIKTQQTQQVKQTIKNNSNSVHQSQNQQINSLEILMLKMQNISEQKQQQFELDNQEELVKNQSLEINLTLAQNNNEFNFNNSPTGINSSSSNLNSNNCYLTNSTNSINTLNSSNSNLSSPLASKCLGNDENQYELSKFVFDYKFCYADFARQRALIDVTTFRVQDYSWSDHAYSLVNRLYSDVGTMLDEKFITTYNLTYYTMGRKTNVDTSVFRQAIWNYIQCMYGIRHDDYDYHEVNELLERPLKTYIKTVCCFPHQTRRKDCDTVMREFRRSEKIHVNIMILEARLQAELLYALRTISRYMT